MRLEMALSGRATVRQPMGHSPVACNLASLRTARNLSQWELAERAGLPRQTYQAIESGSVSPRSSTLHQLLLVDVREGEKDTDEYIGTPSPLPVVPASIPNSAPVSDPVHTPAPHALVFVNAPVATPPRSPATSPWALLVGTAVGTGLFVGVAVVLVVVVMAIQGVHF